MDRWHHMTLDQKLSVFLDLFDRVSVSRRRDTRYLLRILARIQAEQQVQGAKLDRILELLDKPRASIEFGKPQPKPEKPGPPAGGPAKKEKTRG